MARFRPPGQCPVCGEWVYKGAASCEECGACAQSGWKMEGTDGLDLPDDEFDYDAFVEREFGGASRQRLGRGRMGPVFWWAGVVLLISFLYAALRALL